MSKSKDQAIERIIKEEQKFKQCCIIDDKLQHETKQGGPAIIIFGIISIGVIFSIGFSVTKNKERTFVVDGSQSHYLEEKINEHSLNFSSTTSMRKTREAKSDMCVMSEHTSNCWLQLCPAYGVMDCFNEIQYLNKTEMHSFIIDSCHNYEQNTGCQLLKNNTTLLFEKTECGIVCKMLL